MYIVRPVGRATRYTIAPSSVPTIIERSNHELDASVDNKDERSCKGRTKLLLRDRAGEHQAGQARRSSLRFLIGTAPIMSKARRP